MDEYQLVTNSSPLKINGWKLEDYIISLGGPSLVSEAMSKFQGVHQIKIQTMILITFLNMDIPNNNVSFREGNSHITSIWFRLMRKPQEKEFQAA